MRTKNGFSLMEMMVVLLIMSIIAAATAPIVSRKMTRSAGSNASPWVFTGQGKNIAFNMGGLDNATAIIGAAKVPDGTKTRLYIDCGDSASQLSLGSGDQAASILADPVKKRVGIFSAASNTTVSDNSIAIGMNHKSQVSSAYYNPSCIAIGNDLSYDAHSIVIGTGSKVEQGAIAIGEYVKAKRCDNVAIGARAEALGKGSIAIGSNYMADAYNPDGTIAESSNSIAIGYEAHAGGGLGSIDSIAIGAESLAKGSSSVSINGNSYGEHNVAISGRIDEGNDWGTAINGVAGNYAIAIGGDARGDGAIAIGQGIGGSTVRQANAYGKNSIAIGEDTYVNNDYSVAIGYGVSTTADNQIVLGRGIDTVYIPGNLVVGGAVYILGDSVQNEQDVYLPLYIRPGTLHSNKACRVLSRGHILYTNSQPEDVNFSDIRLKNIGDKYTAGIEKLKKLNFYHYTFKKDETKTPHVGVIAQDLQKVFPDAVTKGDDGYLRIRFEDMFYAVINAVKELDAKITAFAADITGMKDRIEAQDKLIEAQQKTIEELQKQLDKQNEVFSKRLNKLEGREG